MVLPRHLLHYFYDGFTLRSVAPFFLQCRRLCYYVSPSSVAFATPYIRCRLRHFPLQPFGFFPLVAAIYRRRKHFQRERLLRISHIRRLFDGWSMLSFFTPRRFPRQLTIVVHAHVRVWHADSIICFSLRYFNIVAMKRRYFRAFFLRLQPRRICYAAFRA